jgi:N-methylhydantoinase A/oxoprolinase/acetone carboxylase beta subunit
MASEYKLGVDIGGTFTDIVLLGPDGALYFLTGGRRLESDLYRVYYGDNTGNNEKLEVAALTDAQKTRR